MLIYNIKNQVYVARFLVQWVKSINVAESLRICMEALDEDSMPLEPDEEPDPLPDLLEVLHRVIDHFSNMSIYTSDIHDSLVDWYITYLRGNFSDLDNILVTCRHNDKEGDGSLVRVCANVFVHHGKDLLDTKNHFKLWLRDRIRQSVRGRIPGDVMDLAFNHHCAYHQHSENEICYRQTFFAPSRPNFWLSIERSGLGLDDGRERHSTGIETVTAMVWTANENLKKSMVASILVISGPEVDQFMSISAAIVDSSA